MFLKLLTEKFATAPETEATGTFADGAFEQSLGDLPLAKRELNRSAHERDYAAGRKINKSSIGFA